MGSLLARWGVLQGARLQCPHHSWERGEFVFLMWPPWLEGALGVGLLIPLPMQEDVRAP